MYTHKPKPTFFVTIIASHWAYLSRKQLYLLISTNLSDIPSDIHFQNTRYLQCQDEEHREEEPSEVIEAAVVVVAEIGEEEEEVEIEAVVVVVDFVVTIEDEAVVVVEVVEEQWRFKYSGELPILTSHLSLPFSHL